MMQSLDGNRTRNGQVEVLNFDQYEPVINELEDLVRYCQLFNNRVRFHAGINSRWPI